MTMEEYRKKKLEIYKKITGDSEFNKEKGCYLEACIRCNGACCRNFPCSFSPDDFVDIDDLDYMKRILDTGYFVISTFSTYYTKYIGETIYYIRPRGIKDESTMLANKIPVDNECIFHTVDGCLLDFYTRPSEGALLVPHKGSFGLGICSNNYSYDDLMENWREHQDSMNELVKYYYNKSLEINKPDKGKLYKLKKKLRQGE